MYRWKESVGHTSREDSRSPTVALESLMLSCLIDSIQGRDSHHRHPGSVMQADIDEEMVHLRLNGKMAKLLTEVSQTNIVNTYAL